MGERRKKTQGGNDDGKAAGKNPRARKARPNREQSRNPERDAPQCERSGQNGPEGTNTASASSTPSTPQEPGSAPGAPLPGEFYQRAGRWWWRVKLPGESKAKARPLKPQGAKAAAEDRQSAERIAFEMWEHALQDDAARQIKLESTEKIERLKAQFLDKVRHFTELVQTANAKIEVEAKARAEAEAKLAQALQAAPLTAAVETAPPAANPQDALVPPPAPVAQPSPVPPSEERVPPPATLEIAAPAIVPTLPLQKAPESETPHVEIPTGVCDCCGASGIATTCLTLIDSGQSLCPRCLTALRSDIARLDSDSLD